MCDYVDSLEDKITCRSGLTIFFFNFFLDMDVFWAECYEMTKVLAHKRSREVGESKLKFQAKYEEPYGHVVKVENTRFSNFLGKITKLNR